MKYSCLLYTSSPESIDTNQLGIHQITYTATDNWNRTTTKVRTIEVVSKVKSNSIEVYNPNESSTDLLFKIDFDASNKKFLVNKSQDTNTETQGPNDNAEEQESRTGELAPDEENVEEGENPDNQNPEETIPPVSYTHLMD